MPAVSRPARIRIPAPIAALALLTPLLAAHGVAFAGSACLPDELVNALSLSKSVRIVKLGPSSVHADGSHADGSGRFVGFAIRDTIAVRGEPAMHLLSAFDGPSRFACGAGDFPLWSRPDAPAGTLGLEFATPRGPVQLVLSLPAGRAELGFVRGDRYTPPLSEECRREWTSFILSFTRERHSTPEAFLETLFEGQGSPQPVPARDPDGKTRPRPRPPLGEYPYVEVLPEAIERVPPAYPPAAREARIEGTVLVQAHVSEQGTVDDVRVTKSIPGLDAAAIACLRQWRFKPATSEGKPIAVWVTVPVKFALH